jgi:hypothetical protein
LIVAALAGSVELALIFGLVPSKGYLAAAAILSAYLIVSVSIIVWRGVIELRRRSALAAQAATGEAS